jgi:hypothetical protein
MVSDKTRVSNLKENEKYLYDYENKLLPNFKNIILFFRKLYKTN